MRKYYYRTVKNLSGGLILGILTACCGWAWFDKGGGWTLAGTLLFGAGAALCIRAGASSEPAIAFDNQRLSLRGALQSARVPWRQVHAIGVEVVTTRYMGLIPISKQTILSVRVEGGLFGSRNIRISLGAVDLPPGGPAELLGQLQAAHVAAIGVAGVAMAGAGEHGWGVAPSRSDSADQGFDADAVFEQYRAKQQPESGAGDVAPASVPPRPAGPARPVFGRRTA